MAGGKSQERICGDKGVGKGRKGKMLIDNVLLIEDGGGGGGLRVAFSVRIYPRTITTIVFLDAEHLYNRHLSYIPKASLFLPTVRPSNLQH